MSLTIKMRKYENPSEGLHTAVLANITDSGERATKFGIKDQFKFDFYIGDEVSSTGKPLRAWTYVNKETGPRSKLSSYWNALNPNLKPINDELNLEPLINGNCRLQITHAQKDGRTYANITAIYPPLPAAPKLIIPSEFVLYGRTDSNAPGGYQSTMLSPADDYEPKTPANPSPYRNVEEMKAAAGVEKTPAVMDIPTNIAKAKSKLKGHGPFFTGEGPAKEDDRPLQ